MRSIWIVIALGLGAAACGKNVPLAGLDAPADPRCAMAVVDGSPCSPEGLVCTYPASCGVDTRTCSAGKWVTDRCETARHCPCLGPSDCDNGGQCNAGVCEPTNNPACGALGTGCCGGFCGTCGAGLVCTADKLCEWPNPPGSTLGAACTLQCNGTSNCDPGEYCPDSCLQCPCTDACHAQAAICTLGDDQSCNDDATSDAMLGHCQASQGPFSTTCACTVEQNPQTGKCL